jgi:hypothetical protein
VHGLFQGNDDKFRIKLNVTVAQIRQRVEVVPSLELNDRKHLQAIAIHPVRSEVRGRCRVPLTYPTFG